jgi:hypothetical protein
VVILRWHLQEHDDTQVPLLPDPEILGFHEEYMGRQSATSDAFKKEATSTNATIVAQRARVSPGEKHYVVPTR